MYHLVRRCSSYTEEDITLGIFNTLELAEKGKESYITTILNTDDPHHYQGYMEVDLHKDVEIEEIEGEVEGFSTVICLFEIASAFGQVHRRLRCITKSTAEAEEAAMRIHAEDIADGGWVCEWIYETIKLNVLRFKNADPRDASYVHV